VTPPRKLARVCIGPWAGKGETGSMQSFLQALPPCPRLRFQIQPRVLDPLEAVLALLDNLVENPLARIQIRMPDPVGVSRVELVALWHLPCGLFQFVEELRVV